MNIYGYVGGDPVNGTDPWGLDSQCDQRQSCKNVVDDVVVTGRISINAIITGNFAIRDFLDSLTLVGNLSGFNGSPGTYNPADPGTVKVTAPKKSKPARPKLAPEQQAGIPFTQLANDVCNKPVRNPQGKMISPNQARRRVRAENSFIRTFANAGAAIPGTAGFSSFAINRFRLAPGGSFDTNPGNHVYGAVMNELGFYDWQSKGLAQGLELAEQIGLKKPNDEEFWDTERAQNAIATGAKCPG
jgi:hypothetical protein